MRLHGEQTFMGAQDEIFATMLKSQTIGRIEQTNYIELLDLISRHVCRMPFSFETDPSLERESLCSKHASNLHKSLHVVRLAWRKKQQQQQQQ